MSTPRSQARSSGTQAYGATPRLSRTTSGTRTSTCARSDGTSTRRSASSRGTPIAATCRYVNFGPRPRNNRDRPPVQLRGHRRRPDDARQYEKSHGTSRLSCSRSEMAAQRPVRRSADAAQRAARLAVQHQHRARPPGDAAARRRYDFLRYQVNWRTVEPPQGRVRWALRGEATSIQGTRKSS